MNKRKYETPLTTKKVVEVESGFMSASVFEPESLGNGIKAENHEVSGEIGFDEPDYNWKWDE